MKMNRIKKAMSLLNEFIESLEMKTTPTNEPICSPELSKALKEAGFDWPCDYWYYNGSFADKPKGSIVTNGWVESKNVSNTTTKAPTIFQAQLWLQTKNIYVWSAPVVPECKEWSYFIHTMFLTTTDEQELQFFNSMPEALEAGLSEAVN